MLSGQDIVTDLFLRWLAAVVSAAVDRPSVLDDSARAGLPSSGARNAFWSPQPQMSPESSCRFVRNTRKQIEVRGSFRSEVKSSPPHNLQLVSAYAWRLRLDFIRLFQSNVRPL